MDIKNTISSTEARQKFAEILNDIEKNGAYYTFTVNGKAKVVAMSVDDYEGWIETMEIMRDPKLYRRLLKLKNTPYRPEDYVRIEAVLGAKTK